MERDQLKESINSFLQLNVNQHTEKKGTLTYLSWAWAMQEALKNCCDLRYEVEKNADGIPCFGNPDMGYIVRTNITIHGMTREMWLPVMDFANKSLLKPSTVDINKSIMRCLTKNLAMFGLGLYIYAGEDLPEETEEQKAEKLAVAAAAADSKKFSEFKKALEAIEAKHEGIIDAVLIDFAPITRIEDVPADERKAFYQQVKGLAMIEKAQEKNDGTV